MSKFHISFVIYLLALSSVTIWLYSNDTAAMLFFYLLISLVYSLVLFGMSMMIRTNFYGNATHQNTSNTVVLTFDDGPHPTETIKVLDILDTNNIKAVFFMIGKNVSAHPQIAKEVIKRGHQVGIHSQNHTWNFGFLVGKYLTQELTRCQNEIENATGVKPTLFRPPFGVTNPSISNTAKKLGLEIVGWNVRSFDTVAKSEEAIINTILTKVNSNSIILLHDRTELTTQALPKIIEKVTGMGFAFGPLK